MNWHRVALAVGAFAFIAHACSGQQSAEPNVRERLLTETVKLGARGDTLLPELFVRQALSNRAFNGFNEAIDRIFRLPTHGSQPLTEAIIQVRIALGARHLLRRMETWFVTDSGSSTVGLLREPERTRFSNFKWDADDYPGGPVGPNEEQVLALDTALSRIRPERRANTYTSAVVRESEFNDAVWKYIESEERPVSGQEGFKLNRWALASFVTMREAAKRDGVDIAILSSNRLPASAASNAARVGNSYAVARFSSHILGLAMDINLSDDQHQFLEATTRPMSNIIAMRASKAHKWMFVHGADYGWYPYTHEPWHWEYNPPGFRQRFWASYKP